MDAITIIGAGGVGGIGATRCLTQDKSLYVQGYDSSEWGQIVRECKEPNRRDNMRFPVPDQAVLHFADHPKCYLPSREEIEICQDKAMTAEVIGDLAPKTEWLRDTHGAGGKGAQMISEYLPGRNYSAELVFWDGKLLSFFIKERLGYDIKGSKEPTYQFGTSLISECILDKRLLDLAGKAIHKVADYVDKKPHGVYSVDFKESRDLVPKITEINAGRFLTASYVFYYKTGFNLPLLFVNKFLNKPYKIGKYPKGKTIIRQIDSLPWIGEL
mgnify:CR=1 FL=1